MTREILGAAQPESKMDVGEKPVTPLAEQVRNLYQEGESLRLQKDVARMLGIEPRQIRTLLRKLGIPPHPKSEVSRIVAQNPETKKRRKESLKNYWKSKEARARARQRNLDLWKDDTYRKKTEVTSKNAIKESSKTVEEKIREKYLSLPPSATRILIQQEAETLKELYTFSPFPLRNSEVAERKNLSQKRVANLKTRALTKLGIFRRDGKYNEVVDFSDLILGVEKGRIARTVLNQPNYPNKNRGEIERILEDTEMIRGYVRLSTNLQFLPLEEALRTLAQAKKDYVDLLRFSQRFLFLVAVPHKFHYQEYKEKKKEELERVIFEAIRDFRPGGPSEDFAQFLIQRAKTTFTEARSQPKPGEPLTTPV